MGQINKTDGLAKLVPSIFITQGDKLDTYALEANGRWTKDKCPSELLPSLRLYKTELLKALYEAEWYIRFLQDDGCYPLDRLQVKMEWKNKE